MNREYKWPVPCGISVPQVFTETEVDIEFVRTFAKDAEALGYHSLWVQERIIGTANQLEPINLLSFLSGITKNIRLGTAVIGRAAVVRLASDHFQSHCDGSAWC